MLFLFGAFAVAFADEVPPQLKGQIRHFLFEQTPQGKIVFEWLAARGKKRGVAEWNSAVTFLENDSSAGTRKLRAELEAIERMIFHQRADVFGIVDGETTLADMDTRSSKGLWIRFR